MVKAAIRTARDSFRNRLTDRQMLTLDFLEYHHRLPRLNPPRTFCEKIMHRKLFERDPRMVELSDKIRAKQIVTELLGADWTIPTLWYGNALPPMTDRNWPMPYVLKASHGSNWNIFVREKSDQNWPEIERETAEWLRTRYGWRGREWLYLQMKPRLLVEPYIGSIREAPIDYKLFVFGGKTHFIQVDIGRESKHEQLFYDVEWNRLPWTYVCSHFTGEVERPHSLNAMIEAANCLGKGFPFVRVDLYEIDGKPLFGECTFYPNGGKIEFKPKEVEAQVGSLWPMSPAGKA